MTVSNLKKNAESKIGNAENKAREIIDDAVKTAEAKKKESLWKLKRNQSRIRMNLRESQRNADLNYRDMRSVYFKEEALDKRFEAIEKARSKLYSKRRTVEAMLRRKLTS